MNGYSISIIAAPAALALALVLAAAGCGESQCGGGKLEKEQVAGGEFTACVDSAGRYHGPARARVVTGGVAIEGRGRYDRDTPSGAWSCARGGERMTIQFDAAAFREQLWGVDGPPAAIERGRHLGPQPTALCPDGEWSELPRRGIAISTGVNLRDLGVAVVTEYSVD